MKNSGRLKTTAILTALILVSVIFQYLGAARLWDIGVSDWLNQRESVTNKKIYIIGIDDKTLEQYGPVNTWSQDLPAQLVEMLNADEKARPAVIGFDIIYSEKADEKADSHFADACREAGNVVVARSFSFKEMPEKDENGKVSYNPYHVDYVIEPYDSLRESAFSGYANTTVDADGYVRQAMAFIDYEGERAFSLSSQIYKLYQESRGMALFFRKPMERATGFILHIRENPAVTM